MVQILIDFPTGRNQWPLVFLPFFAIFIYFPWVLLFCYILKGFPPPPPETISRRQLPSATASLKLDARSTLVSKECACGVCDRYHNDYNVFDDEGRECCKCKDNTPKCFPAPARVSLENGKFVKISELQPGDRVQTGMKSVAMSQLKLADRVQTGIDSVRMYHRY